MLVLLAAVEASVGRRAGDLGDWQALTWRHAGRAARTEAACAGVLCLGDSQVKEGVLPALLEGRLGLPAYNLAVHGGQAPTSFFLLRRALRAGARPVAVVVDFNPNLLSSAPRSGLPYWSDLLDARDAVELGWGARDPELLARTVALGLLPTLRHREALRGGLIDALLGRPGADHGPCLALARNLDRNRGARVTPVTPPPPDPEGPPLAPADRGGWQPHRANVEAIHRLFEAAESRGIAVFWLIPPACPGWQSRRVRMGADAAYARLAGSLARRHRNVVVVDARASAFPPDAFRDQTHLHVAGAAVLTRSLAAVIRSTLAAKARGEVGDSWVALPPAGRLPPARPHEPEDMDESRTAVRAGGESRRR